MKPASFNASDRSTLMWLPEFAPSETLQHIRHLVRAVDEDVSASVAELFGSAISPEYADRPDPVVSGAGHIVATIPHHPGTARRGTRPFEDEPDQFGLVATPSVEFGAENSVNKRVEVEILDDSFGKNLRF